MELPQESVSPPGDGAHLTGRRDLLKKLAVGGAIVWTAPLITTARHAAAAATCAPRTLNWSNFTTGSTFTSTTVAGTTISVATTPQKQATLLSANRTIRAGPNGANPGKALSSSRSPRYRKMSVRASPSASAKR